MADRGEVIVSIRTWAGDERHRADEHHGAERMRAITEEEFERAADAAVDALRRYLRDRGVLSG